MEGEGQEFDRFAESYDEELNRGLRRSGETKDFFAQGRINFLRKTLGRINGSPRILDFGCGTGNATPFLLEAFPGSLLLGADVSEQSLNVARREQGRPNATFRNTSELSSVTGIDLAYCNGVFHHIPPAERAGAAAAVCHTLRPGAVFALFENNPWNPVTVKAMKECAFDDDAITLTPPETRGLLKNAGFKIERTAFLFFFPRQLRKFRFLEPFLHWFPLGAQYVVLARKT